MVSCGGRGGIRGAGSGPGGPALPGDHGGSATLALPSIAMVRAFSRSSSGPRGFAESIICVPPAPTAPSTTGPAAARSPQ